MKVPSCADVYTKMVFRPLVEKVWNLLRSAWNEIESFLLDLKKCCFILETFQIILNCIEDCVSFPPCIYLNNELKEWKRILYRAYNIFAESILEATGLPNLQDTLKCLEYCQGTDQVVELNDLSWFPSYMKEITKYLKFEPGRSHFLNIIAEAFCKKTVEMVLCPSPLLYLNSRKCLAYFCQKVMETFILKCESQQYFQKIQDIITLLEVSNNEARQFIQEIEQENKKKEVNHSEVSDNDNDVPTMRPFLGVQLVMKAEKLIKESTRQMLSTTKFNNPHASNSSTLLCSTASSQISQFFFINKIKTLSDDECYIVLKRRREFAFSMSIGFSSN
ncbi:uncharacterized protein LOC128884388 isoform X2 [Hylaeus volcanicus]|nr:uncharacterized protein LOC128884388 isoform X2 [Hylaeus volcanicus]